MLESGFQYFLHQQITEVFHLIGSYYCHLAYHQWTSRKIKSYCSELTNICVDIAQLRQEVYAETMDLLGSPLVLPSNNYEGIVAATRAPQC